METCVQLIFVLALVKFSLKAALSGNRRVIAGYAAGAALFSLAIYPAVIEQPVTIVALMLENRTMVGDMALLTTVEAIAGIFIAVYLLDNYFMPKSRRRKTAFVLKIVPGVLFFCAVGYFELLFFRERAGHDFTATALLYAALLFAGVLGTAWLLRMAVREESLKLEIKLLLNFCILILGLLVSSSVADYSVSHAQTQVEWGALVAMLLTFAVLIAAGIGMQKLDFKKLMNKR